MNVITVKTVTSDRLNVRLNGEPIGTVRLFSGRRPGWRASDSTNGLGRIFETRQEAIDALVSARV